MADIATAYVQIVPSARGLKGNLEKELDGSGAGEAAGEKAGTSFFSKMKTVLAAAGVGKLVAETLKKSIGEGAALEQSMGGVETLFKDSAATVIANAQQAYETAGMSANEYMEQVTSFSARLLQSVGGNTAEAASVADMAMRDMSDNANKFGADIDSITNAYQGFAKQNFTMLGNLKLGYDGTKSEMERLLADAQKLTGVEYDINNLSDVYNAIHAVQEELGVTGTTAAEASSTLTGSLNAMKAAFSNVMGNLALGEEMGPSLETLASTVGTFIRDNLFPKVWNIIKALPGAIVTLVKAMIPENMGSIVKEMVAKLGSSISQKLKDMSDNGKKMISETATGFVKGIPGFLQSAKDLVTQLLGKMRNALPSMLSSGADMVAKLANGIKEKLPEAASSMGSVLAELLTTIAAKMPDLLNAGIKLIGNLIAGLISMVANVTTTGVKIVKGLITGTLSLMADIAAAGVKLVKNLISGILSMAGSIATAAVSLVKSFCNGWESTNWRELGTNIIDGIKSGITSAAYKIVSAAREAASKALNAAKSFLGIRSPSRVFRDQVGAMIPKGLALGIADGELLVERAMKSLTDTTTADMLSTVRINAQGGSTSTGTNGTGYSGRTVQVVQNIYSQAKTAADLMQEARYQAEMAVLLDV